MKNAPFTRKIFFAGGITLIATCLILFYVYTLSTTNEKLINARAFRLLHLMASNLKEKTRVTRRNLESYKKEFEFKYLLPTRDTTFNYQGFNKSHAAVLLSPTPGQNYKWNTVAQKNDPGKAIKPASFFVENDSLFFLDYVKSKSVLFKFGLEQFIRPIFRSDFFDECIILDEAGLPVYHTFSSKISTDSLLRRIHESKDIGSGKIKMMQEEKEFYLYFTKADMGKTSWYLCTLISAEKYNKSRFSIPKGTIFLILMVVISLMVSFPFLKFLFMSESERLHTHDLALVWCSLLFGSSLFFLGALQLYGSWNTEYNLVEPRLKNLGSKMETRFTDELKSMYEEAAAYDQWSKDTSRLYAPKKYKDFQYLFFVNRNNAYQYLIYPNNANTPLPVKLEDRPYFRNIIQGKTWNFSDVPGGNFFLQSILSYTDGNISAVLSKPSSSHQGDVVAIEAKPSSLFNCVLPMGYGFAIINDKGETLFHSDSTRNLQENFLTECNDEKTIQTALKNGASLYTKNQYYGKPFKMWVKPLNEIPLFLVVFYDLNYQDSLFSESLSLSFIALIFLFIIYLIVSLFHQLFMARESDLKIPFFKFKWFFPDRRNHLNYLNCLFVQVILFFAILVCIYFLETHTYADFFILIYVFLLSSVYLLCIQFNFLNASDRFFTRINIFFILVILFIHALFATLYEGDRLKHVFPVILIDLPAVLVWIWPYRKPFRKSLKYPDVISEGSFYHFRKTYVLMLLGWIGLISVLPACYLYQVIFREEARSLAKAELQDAVNSLSRRSFNTCFYEDLSISQKTGTSNQDERKDDSPVSEVYQRIFFETRPLIDTISIRTYGTIHAQSNEQTNVSFTKDSITLIKAGEMDAQGIVKYTSYATLIQDGLQHYSHGLMLFFVLSIVFFFCLLYLIILHLCNNVFLMKFVNSSHNKGFDSYFLSEDSKANVFLITLPYDKKVQEVLAILKIAYKEVDFSSDLAQQLTPEVLLQVPSDHVILLDDFDFNMEDLDSNTKKIRYLSQLTDDENHRIIVQSAIHPNQIFKVYKTKIREATDPAKIQLLKFQCDQFTRLLGNYFIVYRPEDSSALPSAASEEDGLEYIYDLIEQECCNRTFLRDLIPSLYTFLKEKLKQESILMSPGKRKGMNIHVEQITRDHLSIRYTTADFRLTTPEGIFHKSFRKLKQSIIKTLHPEVNAGTVDSPEIFFIPVNLTRLKEEIILKIQSLAEGYYFSIWSSLSAEERYVLYDMAQDGVVNWKNVQAVNSLLAKRLLVVNGTVEIMNKSFRNFILTHTKQEDALQIEREIRVENSWDLWKFPVLLLLLGIITFIFFTQQGTSDKVIAIVSGFVTLLPLVVKLLSLFSAKSVKE